MYYIVGSSFSTFHGIFTSYEKCHQALQTFLKKLSSSESKCFIYIAGGIDLDTWTTQNEFDAILQTDTLCQWFEWTPAKGLIGITTKRGYSELQRRKESRGGPRKRIMKSICKSLLD